MAGLDNRRPTFLEEEMKSGLATLTLMAVTTAVLLGIPLMFSTALPVETMSYRVDPGVAGGDVATIAPAAPSRWDRFLDKALDNMNTAIWAIIQAIIIGRYVKERKA